MDRIGEVGERGNVAAQVAPTPIGNGNKSRVSSNPDTALLLKKEDLEFGRACQRTIMSAAKPASKEISPKLRKTIDRLQSRIKESADYEVHQELKAIANRCSPLFSSRD